MKQRAGLPAWVILGACALACIAGMVNVTGYMGFEHQGITHLTGTTTLLGEALSGGNWHASLQLLAMILAFVLGAVVSGAIIQDVQLRLRRRYGVALALESALLFAAAALFKDGSLAGPLLAAAACGLQNAIATTYSGALVRTTHLSGLFTDLGIAIGHALRGRPWEFSRIQLSILTIGAFAFGCIVGALLFRRFSYDALYVPATWTGVVGIGYALYHHHRFSRHESRSQRR
ncbi:DUF1275 domain-containing protein [Lysobacter pythonis]|uniref:DUF1275 domain-containing protein n=1 Tax=Solilutibacter pythonis TaxID=2483112 RepID=A0A3M2HTE9_9GAMM|nr:YoaK family protein [Lysobacter pythonis]RMH93021.1 DUF1275 domain-containing protein [Lysobacter pythonis]